MKLLKKSALPLFLGLFPLVVHAVDPLEDEEMGEITGQVGFVNAAVKSEVEYEKLGWIDTEGEAGLKDGQLAFETVDGVISMSFDKNAKNEDVLRFEIPDLAISSSTNGYVGSDGKSLGQFGMSLTTSPSTLFVKGH